MKTDKEFACMHTKVTSNKLQKRNEKN